MKRAVLMVAVAALCVAGSAVAQDRSGLIGSGTRSEDSGQMMGSGNAAGQTMGSGGFTTSSQDSGQVLGSGARSEDTGGLIGSGTRTMDAGGLIGSGTRQQMDGGYLGSGLSVREIPLLDGSSLLVVRSDQGTFIIPILE